MTTFDDGPAKGKALHLKTSPQFLRVVQDSKGNWDALDLMEDEPRPDETLYAYVLLRNDGWCHLNRGKGRGGFYPISTYQFCKEQPSQLIMRDPQAWSQWCTYERS